MTVESALYAIAAADAGVAALVGTRIYRERLPQGETLPALVYQQVSELPDLAHSGPAGTSSLRYQFNCYGANPTAAEALKNALVTAFHGYSGTTGSRTMSSRVVAALSLPDRDTEYERRIVDVMILDEGDTA